MTHMLCVAAFKVGYPVTVLIFMKAGYGLFHSEVPSIPAYGQVFPLMFKIILILHSKGKEC